MSDPATLPIELWDVDKLVPYEKNNKKHPTEQVEKLAALIRRFGITPLEVWTDAKIIKGHGRRLAILHNRDKHGIKIKVPVIVRADLSKDEADALRIADNKVTSTEYDVDATREEMIRLQDLGFEALELGFDEKEAEKLLAEAEAFDESALVEDIGEAVETQKTENAAKEKAADGESVPVSESLGFKRVTVEQSRLLRDLIGRVEPLSGASGADVLIWALDYAADKLGA